MIAFFKWWLPWWWGSTDGSGTGTGEKPKGG